VPLEVFINEAARELSAKGFAALDLKDGRLGGERHGLWDWTWTKPWHRSGACFVSIFARQADRNRYDLEIHAGASKDRRYGDVLTAFFALIPDQARAQTRPPWQLEALREVNRGAKRATEFPAGLLTEQRTVESVYGEEGELFDIAALVAPMYPNQAELFEPILELFRSSGELALRNADVLHALLDRRLPADRASVNAVLSALARRGDLHRLKRGLYIAGGRAR
jgi:hypothetical protein